MARLGFIGGSGLYDIPGMNVTEEKEISTPWGSPSDKVILGTIEGVEVAFLARHGRGHTVSPTEVNSRANIYALHSLGVRDIVAFSAVGSLREEIEPLHFVLPDQIIDRTRLRPNTFFGDGIVAHVGFSEPFFAPLRELLAPCIEKVGVSLHQNKTLVVMEGPAFSTKAESHLYRSWGADIINMSALPESKLAREADICYQMICMSTDYDCWHESEEAVTVEMVIANLMKNAENAKAVVLEVVKALKDGPDYERPAPTRTAVITAPEKWPAETVKKLDFILKS